MKNFSARQTNADTSFIPFGRQVKEEAFQNELKLKKEFDENVTFL